MKKRYLVVAGVAYIAWRVRDHLRIRPAKIEQVAETPVDRIAAILDDVDIALVSRGRCVHCGTDAWRPWPWESGLVYQCSGCDKFGPDPLSQAAESAVFMRVLGDIVDADPELGNVAGLEGSPRLRAVDTARPSAPYPMRLVGEVAFRQDGTIDEYARPAGRYYEQVPRGGENMGQPAETPTSEVVEEAAAAYAPDAEEAPEAEVAAEEESE